MEKEHEPKVNQPSRQGGADVVAAQPALVNPAPVGEVKAPAQAAAEKTAPTPAAGGPGARSPHPDTSGRGRNGSVVQ